MERYLFYSVNGLTDGAGENRKWQEQEEFVVDAVFVDRAIRWEQRRTTSGWTVAGRAGKTYEDERGRFALNHTVQCETASFDGTWSDGMQARKRREKGVLSSIFRFRGR
jgi:hypothetical protein